MLRLAREQKILIFASEPLLLEIETTLKRDKFQERLQQRARTVEYLMEVVREFSQLCPTTTVNVPELRAPKDASILAAAFVANVQAIITGDFDLLVLDRFEGIIILKPRDFLNSYFPRSQHF